LTRPGTFFAGTFADIPSRNVREEPTHLPHSPFNWLLASGFTARILKRSHQMNESGDTRFNLASESSVCSNIAGNMSNIGRPGLTDTLVKRQRRSSAPKVT